MLLVGPTRRHSSVQSDVLVGEPTVLRVESSCLAVDVDIAHRFRVPIGLDASRLFVPLN